MHRQPKVAFLDIETAPSLGFFFDKWKENNIIATQADWYILSFAVKWGDKRVKTHALPDYPLYDADKENDRDLVKDLHKVFDEADIIVAHNGDRFDVRKSNARFLQHGLHPPSHYRTIDTLKIARAKFKFDSNRLDDLGQSLGIGRKLANTGVRLWLGCMRGDMPSWRAMRRYNARDVDLLHAVYTRLRPWATNHPNLRLYTGADSCPTCQSGDIEKRGLAYNQTTVKQRWKCRGCGASWNGDTVKSDRSKSASTSRRTERTSARIRSRARPMTNRSRRGSGKTSTRKRSAS